MDEVEKFMKTTIVLFELLLKDRASTLHLLNIDYKKDEEPLWSFLNLFHKYFNHYTNINKKTLINKLKKVYIYVMTSHKVQENLLSKDVGEVMFIINKWEKHEPLKGAKTVKSFKKTLDEHYITEEVFTQILRIYGGQKNTANTKIR